ncbi:uncharacterized protein TNCV_2059981 [Trichonephila clavipes]|nr:uncharacterized protein TNCV_2059981 [Trichonephila clavipes]
MSFLGKGKKSDLIKFAIELGWLNELKIDSFDGLKNSMIADQMKKRCFPEYKEYYLDIWEDLISPEMKPERPPKREYSHQIPNERSLLRCYGSGKQGLIKSTCPTCNLNDSQRTGVATNHINAYIAQTRSPRLNLIDITFCGIKGRVCADTGSSHSIAGKDVPDNPVPAQRFETLAIDLFGPLPEKGSTVVWHSSPPYQSQWNPVLSAVMQQICYPIKHPSILIPVYHPQANPAEQQKIRDLKPRLTILVQEKHGCWSEKLPLHPLLLSTQPNAKTTGQTAAFLNFW